MQNVVAAGHDGIALDGGSIILANPEGFKNTELIVKRYFLSEEAIAQQPTFAWESMPDTRMKTHSALMAEKNALDEVVKLERRAREYCAEKQVLKQVKRVQIAARQTSVVAQNVPQ
eukprot:IDg2078t1